MNEFIHPESAPGPTRYAMDPSLWEMADHYFQTLYDLNLEQLLAPVGARGEASSEAGVDLRGSDLFRQIEEARRADDPSLPLGPWERELKKADWPLVGKACLKTLAGQSKDLQLAAWAVESGIHLYGMVALLPGIVLLHALCERYWESMHPGIQDDDLEFRTNLFRWLDRKMPDLLALCPLTQANGDNGVQTLGDWRRANLPAEDGGSNKSTQDAFLTALANTPTSFLADMASDLRQSHEAIACLDRLLDERCGNDSPGFNGLNRILQEIQSLVEGELANRGHTLEAEQGPQEESPAALDADTAAPSPPINGILNRREDAYAMLAQAADFLIHADPHSPAPYLVRQAIAWGRMDTRSLYQQLFLEQGGQINVFELLGLNVKQKEDAA